MTKLPLLWCLGILLTLSSCGRLAEEEEICRGNACSEAELNAPVGEQPTPEEILPYGGQVGDPPLETLKFPAYRSSWGLKRAIYDKAVAYYAKNRAILPNPRYATLIDLSQHSGKKRWFLFNLATQQVQSHNVSHGLGSDPDGDGMATLFSNTEGSKMSSLGIYHTQATYNGKHGYSLRLLGLEATNSNAFSRAIVVHPAAYVSDGEGRAGRSWGCPALDPKISQGIIDKIKNGSLFLIGR
jgi:hypothetical protein